MRRRICFLLLTAVLLLGLFPIAPAQAAPSADYDLQNGIRANVSAAVRAYAGKVKQTGSHTDALTDMAYHAMLKSSATLYLSDNSSVIASMFNALMFQEGLTEGITNAIIQAQDLGLAEFFSNGAVSWHVYGDNYYFNGWLGNKRDPSKYLAQHTHSQTIYGGFYPGAQNEHDTAMQLIAGGLGTEFVLKRTAVKADTVVYEVALRIHDYFDFQSTYSQQADKGYDVTIDRLLVKLGRLLNLMGADDFEWEYSTRFQVEVPYACDHTSGSHRWVYDAAVQQMISVPGNGFQDNPTVAENYTASDGTVRRYFKLQEPVQLLHNKPWVVEYDSADTKSLTLSATASPVTLPTLSQSGHSYTWIREYTYTQMKVDREGTSVTDNLTHYTGVKVSGQFKYNSKHTYTYRLENRVADNGSNMIWLSIYNKTTGEIAMAPTPMDEYSTQAKNQSGRTLVSENSTRLSGKDLIINYIGSRWNNFDKTSLELRIWENGQDIATASTTTTSYKAPTCTEDGGYSSTCTRCGYVSTQKEAAKGHRFDTWNSNHDATCEADGTVSANCTVCGAMETRKDPNTAKGHTPHALPEQAPSCTTTGLTQGSQCTACQKILTPQNIVNATGHNWANATCTTPKTCRTCASTEGDVVHQPVQLSPVAPNCTQSGLTEGSKCEMCNTVLQPQNVIAALGHNWCEATCTAAKTCATCATTEGEALGHSEQILDSLSPTCIQPGLTEGKRCTRCDHVLVEQQTIPAFGHTWQAATCTMPKTCLACADTEGEPLPHTQIPLNAQAPTCMDTGLTEGIGCAGCDTILQEQKTVPAFGHSWLDATCQAPATCEVCKLTQGSPLPHQAIVEGAFSPTCTTPGSTGTILCSACSTQLEAPLAIAAIGHADMDEDRICDLCTHHLINPTKIAIVAVLCVSTVAATAAVAIILIRKRKVK